MKIINERLSGIDNVFDAEREKHKLRELHAHDYAHSIYETASQSATSHRSEITAMAAKRAEAAAELAAKEAQYKLMEEERKQKEKIRMTESELERFQAEKDVKVARVKLESYDREMKLRVSPYSKLTVSSYSKWTADTTGRPLLSPLCITKTPPSFHQIPPLTSSL